MAHSHEGLGFVHGQVNHAEDFIHANELEQEWGKDWNALDVSLEELKTYLNELRDEEKERLVARFDAVGDRITALNDIKDKHQEKVKGLLREIGDATTPPNVWKAAIKEIAALEYLV